MFGFNFASKKEDNNKLETLLSAAADYGVAKELETSIKENLKMKAIRDDLKARDTIYGIIQAEQKQMLETILDAQNIKETMIKEGRNPEALAQEDQTLQELKTELLGDIAEMHGFNRGAIFSNLKKKLEDIDNTPLI